MKIMLEIFLTMCRAAHTVICWICLFTLVQNLHEKKVSYPAALVEVDLPVQGSEIIRVVVRNSSLLHGTIN